MNVTVLSTNIGQSAVIAGTVGPFAEPTNAPPALTAGDPPGAVPPFEIPPPVPFATPPPPPFATLPAPPFPAFVASLEPQAAAASERTIEANVTVRGPGASLL
jgi:hypothetical protein